MTPALPAIRDFAARKREIIAKANGL